MHDELERTAESAALSSVRAQMRMETLDSAAAIRLAEAAVGSRVHGDPAKPGDAATELLEACRDATEKGQRVAVVARSEALGAARQILRRIARARLGMVAHAIAGHGGEELSALCDVGWGILVASGPEDSFDLSLVARRAAEDSGVPFVVVHALGDLAASARPSTSGPESAGRALVTAMLPPEKACKDFVGPASRLVARHDPAHPSLAPLGDRAFAERVPFALGSALREYGNVAGRRHDVFDKAPLGEPPLMLVGMGPIGDAVHHAVPELRARGYDVGAVHLTALRPFPGPRLVKALARALAVTVLEPADEPLAHGGLLARELKAAFTDALTWAPGFPGIGRVPKLFVGVTGPAFDLAHLAAICDNMLADERGRRSFSLADAEHTLPRPTTPEPRASGIGMRWVLDDLATADAALALTAAVLATGLGVRVHGIVAPHGPFAIVDVQGAREHARGGMARRVPRIVVTTEKGALAPEVTSTLTAGAVLAVLGSAGDGALALSDAARAVARDRRARVVALPAGGPGPSAAAAACAGAALAIASRAQRSPLEPTEVARLVGEHLVARGLPHADVASEKARRAFEATIEVAAAAEADAAAARNGGPAPAA